MPSPEEVAEPAAVDSSEKMTEEGDKTRGKEEVKVEENMEVKVEENVEVKKEEDEETVPAAEEGTAGATAAAKKKKQRPRKRKIYTDVCQQIEFYFSDSNISKNRMMSDLVLGSEYVSLETILGFNKIQKMLPEISIAYLQKSLASSEILELSPDLTGVKRKIPYDPKKLKSDEEIEQCTIYVENVPTHVNHEWLEKIFQEFGPIAYIAMPKFKHNGLPKGFAFIEFKDKEGAERCLNAYGDIGACLPENLNPENLLSVRTFESVPVDSASPSQGSTADNQVASTTSDSAKNKRSREVEEDTPDAGNDVPKKKRKVKEPEPEPEPEDDSRSPSAIPDSTENEDKSGENGESNGQSSAEKKKRRRVYKTKKLDAIEKRESDSIQLKILPKKSWRQLRNRYLNLQREYLGKLKRQLRNQERQQHQQHHHKKQHHHAEEEQEPHPDSNYGSKAKNVIAKIEFDESFENTDALRNKILADVLPKDDAAVLLFVDYENPNLYAHVRLDGNPDYFQEVGEFLRNASSTFKSAAVLTESETQEFWNGVRQKLKSEGRKKVRGRDKLLQQAMKTATHIRFNDGD